MPDPTADDFLNMLKVSEPCVTPSEFVRTRWPHTYAYDYVRGCVRADNATPDYARGEVGALLRGWLSNELGVEVTQAEYNFLRENILIELAARYCRQWNIEIPEDIEDSLEAIDG